MASLEKLNELVGQGVGSKTSVLKYHTTDIITAFTSRSRKIFDILVIDCNTQMVPITALQKTINRIWPAVNEGQGTLVERGNVGFVNVPIYFKEQYLRDGLIANLAVHESNQAVSSGKINQKNIMENFKTSFRSLLVEAKKHNKTIGMPVMGKESTWSTLSMLIDEIADEVAYTLPIRVYRRK